MDINEHILKTQVYTFDTGHCYVPAGDCYGCTAPCDLDLLYYSTCHPAIPVGYSGPTLLVENSSPFPVEDGGPAPVGDIGGSDHIVPVLFRALSCPDHATLGYFPCFALYIPPVINNIFGYIAVITVRIGYFHYALLD